MPGQYVSVTTMDEYVIPNIDTILINYPLLAPIIYGLWMFDKNGHPIRVGAKETSLFIDDEEDEDITWLKGN